MMTDDSAANAGAVASIDRPQGSNMRWCRYDRRLAGCGLLLGLAIFLGGCASLPVGKLVSGPEAAQVLAGFHELQQRQRQCPAGIDAEVTATFLWSVVRRFR